jgi:hypothetical protein
MTDLKKAAQRLLEAWDTTPLFKAGDGMLQERFEVLRAELEKPSTDPAHEYRRGFVDGQIEMRDRPEEQP